VLAHGTAQVVGELHGLGLAWPVLSRPIGVKPVPSEEVEGGKRSRARVIREADAGQAEFVIGRGALDRKSRINETVSKTEAELVHHLRSDGVVVGNDETPVMLHIDVVRQ